MSESSSPCEITESDEDFVVHNNAKDLTNSSYLPAEEVSPSSDDNNGISGGLSESTESRNIHVIDNKTDISKNDSLPKEEIILPNDNNNIILSDVSDFTVLEHDNLIHSKTESTVNDSFLSERVISKTECSVILSDVSDSNKNLTDNCCGSNDPSKLKKNSCVDNIVAPDNSIVEKELLSKENNSVLFDVPNSERRFILIDSSEKSNNVQNFKSSSCVVESINLNNENVEVAKEKVIPDVSNEKSSEKENEKNDTNAALQAKINEYEEAFIKCRENIEVLEKENIRLQNEVQDFKMRLQRQQLDFMKQEASLKADLLADIEKLSKDCNILRKDKEAIVVRYANSEKDVMMAKKVQLDMEKKIRDINKDRECLMLKLKNSAAENNKLSSSLEDKVVEIAKLQKDNEKLIADINSRDIKIKWLQNKLVVEVGAHQDTQGKLEHTVQRLNEMKEEAEQVRKNCQEMIKCYQEAEEIKSVKLDSELKQKLSELEVQKQEKCDQEQVYTLLRHELEALKKKQRSVMEDNNSLTLKINSLEKERLEYEHNLCKLKDTQNMLKEEIADMSSKLTEMEGLKLQLEQEREKSAASLREVERLRLTNAELQADLDACHVKEGDRLDFVEKITAKSMLLQSDHSLLEVKSQALEEEVNQLKKSLSEVQQNNAELVEKYDNSVRVFEKEMQLLAQKLAEKAKLVEKLSTSLEESENENRVLKRRHIASIKELSRELCQCKRRLESYESNSGMRADSVSLGSRTSSSASLHISSSNEICQCSTSPSVTYSNKKDLSNHQGKNGSPDNQCTVDKEVLINRIIQLQKIIAQKTDKIDFLEDHIEQLVREMRKKPKSGEKKKM